MIQGMISLYGKGRLVVFEKEWGNISGDVYRKHVVPAIYAYKEEVKQYAGKGNVIFMEDGAPSHIAKAMKVLHDCNDLWRMKWLVNLPDLNPIKNVWWLLKYQVDKQFPKTDEEVQQYIKEEWERLQVDDFKKYIDQIHERCEAVILANGGHTKW